MASLSVASACAIAAIALILLLARIRLWKSRSHLPPGPKGLPLIGNVLAMPRTHLGRHFARMGDRYGDIVYMDILGQPMIVVNSYEVACELLDKRSATFSGRPQLVMAEMVGMEWMLVLMQYGKEWRRHRRAFHQAFHSEAVAQYQPLQLQMIRRLLARLVESPKNVVQQLNFSFASTLMQLVFGIEISEVNDKYFAMAERVRDIGEDVAFPGRYPVELFPWLRYLPAWFPGSHFKRIAEKARHEAESIRTSLHTISTEPSDSDPARDSLVSRLLVSASREFPLLDDLEEFIKGVSTTAYATGVDTTNTISQVFMLMMAMHPKIQKKAQAELDAVLGASRLPDFSDRSALPYMNALIMELFRFHVVAPLGIPHRTIADEEFRGYFIPAGTVVSPNIWAMSMDPNEYSDPEAFNPERFLDTERQARDPRQYAFGFGRRICPGRHLAEATVFIVCASMLYVFDIKPPVDSNGAPMELEYKVTNDTLLQHPLSYEYIIRPRSVDVEHLVGEIEGYD
ncbi:cytochrome P450 [Ganoderma sinense ZZ0214-1]|uniref:Cytochrome P450 n=1 Tax=Ganoderma sinense ZZ0214-1 TaxID=1077348 RepID=A0A2G8RTH9_9APHY|nr:cytochrome P450 [Ganoderma sinense ZZ0214-1]